MLAGNKIGKPHGTVRYGDDVELRFVKTMISLEKDMGKVLPEDAVSELLMLVKGIPTDQAPMYHWPGCQATESIFYGNDRRGTTLGLMLQGDLLYEAVRVKTRYPWDELLSYIT